VSLAFRVNADMRMANLWLNKVQRKVVPRAAAKSLNDAMRESRKYGAKRAAAKMAIKAWALRRRYFAKAQRRATPRRLNAHFDVGTVDIPMDAARKTTSGNQSYAVGKLKEAGRGVMAGPYYEEGAFIAPSPGSRRPRIFKRTGKFRVMKNGQAAGKRREAVASPTITARPAIMQKTQQAIDVEGKAKWKAQFKQHMKAGLRKARR
jgi:hypothetical protein